MKFSYIFLILSVLLIIGAILVSNLVNPAISYIVIGIADIVLVIAAIFIIIFFGRFQKFLKKKLKIKITIE